MKKTIVLMCAGMLASAFAGADVCSDIARIKREAESNFLNVRGKFIEAFEGAKYYEARFRLAGASLCEIDYDGDGSSYMCKWIGQDVAAYESVVSQVRACLPESRVRTSSSDLYYRVSFYGTGASVHVRYRRSRNLITLRVMP